VSNDQSIPASRRLGSFEVLQELGQGGMGVVFLARQPALDRLVVLKRVHREMLDDPSTAERFQREARSAAAVHHHNVVAVYDCFSARGDDYIAQEFVDGVDLRAVLDKIHPLEPRIAALIALEVIRGLEEIHAQGIVHRDLKPGNILVGCAGEVKIADFGIALEGKGDTLTRPGVMMGSLSYMSPEQMLGERGDYRSDLFLFGILLYEMFTGVTPFDRSTEESPDTLLERIQKGRFELPRQRARTTPRYIDHMIRTCLRAKPSRRVQSSTLLRRLLERRVGNVSPSDCRSEIASYLWERGIFRETEDRTRVRPRPKARAASLARNWQRWMIPATTVGLLVVIVFGVRSEGFGLLRRDPPAAPSQAASGTPPESARVRFVAYPWAEIRTQSGERFLTPRAEPVELQPGRHLISFIHPRFGRAHYTISLAAGEERVISHVFEKAPGP